MPSSNLDEGPASTALDRAAAALNAGNAVEAEHFLLPLTQAVDNPRALAMLAQLRQLQARHDEARAIYRAALDLDSCHYGALCNLAIIESEAEHLDECEALLRRAISVAPELPNAYVNLGIAFEQSSRQTEALEVYRSALQFNPGNALIWFNLGNALLALERIEEAIAAWRNVLAIDPEFTDVFWNLAQAQLLRGSYIDGWATLAQRWKSPQFSAFAPKFEVPQWHGEDIAGKRILLWGEQGFGDGIQFARFATGVAARGATVILAMHRNLCSIAASIDGVAQCVDLHAALPAFDLHCALMDLPRLFQTTLQTIPAAPYLRTPAGLVSAWAARLPAARSLRIGLVWSTGITRHEKALLHGGTSRSFDARVYAPLWRLDADFFSLQTDANCAQLGLPLIDYTGDLKSFSDTAALMPNLDLVISVDTAAVHLAGALDVPVWVILKKNADWRWGSGAATPWYASARIFRQSTAGDWSGPIAQITAELSALIEQHKST